VELFDKFGDKLLLERALVGKWGNLDSGG